MPVVGCRLGLPASRFVDVEAVVDKNQVVTSDDGSDRGSESSIAGDDSVVDSDFDTDTDFQSRSRLTQDLPTFRWDALEQADNNARLFRELADDIKFRFKRSTPTRVAFDLFDDLCRYPAEDPAIWRVQVKKGCERDIILLIIRRIMTMPKSSILSAFSRDAIPGCIYLEAPVHNDVKNVLQGIHGVFRSRKTRSVLMSRVPVDDYIPLLRMGPSSNTITSGSWVRIKRHRKYKQDLALVLDLDKTTLNATVCVVPRIPISRKREHGRPRPAAFDPEVVREIYGEEALRRHNQVWEFQTGIYKDGLEEFDIHVIDLSNTAVNPGKAELHLYRCSQNPQVLAAVKRCSTTWDLRVEDRIRVVAGRYRGLLARVVDVHPDDKITIDVDSDDLPQYLHLSRWDVFKDFSRGDFVEVLSGDFEGRDGYIIDLREDSATIYSRCSLRWGDAAEFEISLQNIQCKIPEYRIRRTTAYVGAALHFTTDGRPAHNDREMHTGDPYAGLEVCILAGDLKRHFAFVKATRIVDGRIMATLRTDNRTVNHMIELDIDILRERHTGLPLLKAIWIPRVNTTPAPPLSYALDNLPSTPMVHTADSLPDFTSGQTMTPAWNPSSRTPPASPFLEAIEDPDKPRSLSEIEREIERDIERLFPTSKSKSTTSRIGPSDPVPNWKPGEWLLDPRLRGKCLDVRIRGTNKTLWRNALYEDACGFLVLTKSHSSVKETVIVKMGYEQSKLSFPLEHIYPETTTERPKIIPHSSATPIIKTLGERVIIIGGDLEGNMDLIGNHAVVVNCPWPLADDQACLQILPVAPKQPTTQFRYFSKLSLCRSCMD